MDIFRFDEIGYWSEIKLDIVRDYAQEYSKIMDKQKCIRKHLYIDAFAGAGVHISRQRGEYILGSPLNALNIEPPFGEYHFIDLNTNKADHLQECVGDNPAVSVYRDDCNTVLLEQVFPRARYRDFRRALCLLDPYALNLNWQVIQTAGESKSIEIFLNFMVMDMNRNVLWKNPEKVSASQIARMNAFWGDDSWRSSLYKKSQSLFEFQIEDKVTNDQVVAAYRQRLKEVAGFTYVPEPIPLRNSGGAVVYYLFFASRNETGANIVEHIFKKYRNRGAG